MAGVPSEGMVMCAETEDRSVIELLQPPAGSEAGDLISFEGAAREPVEKLHKDKKKNAWV